MNYPFDYVAPARLHEASRLMQEEKTACILAGGTDLLISTRSGKVRPALVVDIKKLEGLKDIGMRDGNLHIGALVTIQELKESDLIQSLYPALWQSTLRFGCYEIRLRATIGGNIAHASPGADTSLPLAIYEATVEVESTSGKRGIPLSQFVTGPGKSVLCRGEIITGFTLPLTPTGTKSSYLRVSRVEGMDLAVCNLAMMVLPPDAPMSRKIRIAVGAVAPVPWRAEPVEKFLEDKSVTPEVIASAQALLKESIAPRASSIRGTPEYKKEMIANMLAESFQLIL